MICQQCSIAFERCYHVFFEPCRLSSVLLRRLQFFSQVPDGGSALGPKCITHFVSTWLELGTENISRKTISNIYHVKTITGVYSPWSLHIHAVNGCDVMQCHTILEVSEHVNPQHQ